MIDFLNERFSRGEGLCLAIKNSLKPIDLNLKTTSVFKELYIVDTVGGEIFVDFYVYYIILLHFTSNTSTEMCNFAIKILSALYLSMRQTVIYHWKFQNTGNIKFDRY